MPSTPLANVSAPKTKVSHRRCGCGIDITAEATNANPNTSVGYMPKPPSVKNMPM